MIVPGRYKAQLSAKRLITSVTAGTVLLYLLWSARRDTPGLWGSRHPTPISFEQPTASLEPLQCANASHPVDQLINDADKNFENVLASQSKSLDEAVLEYRRRYGIPPPPNFDKWYEFAKRRGVVLIDEFDTIHHSLLPFWALEPATVRMRIKEAIGYFDSALVAVLIRDGQVTTVEGGDEWQQDATVGMMKNFIEFLPDMDLGFNIHDEPRVIVAHDRLSRLVDIAKNQKMAAAASNPHPHNQFSPRPSDMGKGGRIDEFRTTRFNRFAHQPTWSHSRISCSPDSPARNFEQFAADNRTAYALHDLGFVYNQSAFMDICNSPSLRETYGFFDRPNAFSISQDLVPIFSQSKISSFQDILYPSPWYWADKVHYEELRDVDWEKKESKLYWRGSTTGGFSRAGGWRRQHRQRFVSRINAPDTAEILANRGDDQGSNWQVEGVPREDYKDIIDVAFSHVGQCDPGDCDAQKEFFSLADKAEFYEHWGFKYLLDIDGNAFSGRFYAFLKSKSMVLKMALFQEWHQEWLKPWIHYAPLSLKGDEWLETVRYFAGEEKGKEQAQRIAMQGREWANRALRNDDFEVWFFRLLLE